MQFDIDLAEIETEVRAEFKRQQTRSINWDAVMVDMLIKVCVPIIVSVLSRWAKRLSDEIREERQ